MASKYETVEAITDYQTPRGFLRVTAMVQVTDSRGLVRYRRLTVETNYGETLDNSRNITKTVRENNPGLNIVGRVTFDI